MHTEYVDDHEISRLKISRYIPCPGTGLVLGVSAKAYIAETSVKAVRTWATLAPSTNLSQPLPRSIIVVREATFPAAPPHPPLASRITSMIVKPMIGYQRNGSRRERVWEVGGAMGD